MPETAAYKVAAFAKKSGVLQCAIYEIELKAHAKACGTVARTLVAIFKKCGIDESAIESRYYNDMIDEANAHKSTVIGTRKPHTASDNKSYTTTCPR